LLSGFSRGSPELRNKAIFIGEYAIAGRISAALAFEGFNPDP
jgi:hypothetical protein